jgi:hypothetical protein
MNNKRKQKRILKISGTPLNDPMSASAYTRVRK